jgi:hypothetical protein
LRKAVSSARTSNNRIYFLHESEISGFMSKVPDDPGSLRIGQVEVSLEVAHKLTRDVRLCG